MALTTDRPTEEDFQKMTNDQTHQVMSEFDIGASNARTGRRASPQSTSKAQLVSAIMRGWDTVLAPAVEVAGRIQPASSANASVATRFPVPLVWGFAVYLGVWPFGCVMPQWWLLWHT